MLAAILAVVVAAALAAATLAMARRRAAEQARADAERRLIARDLEEHVHERDRQARFERARDAAVRHGDRAAEAQRRPGDPAD